MNDSWNDEKTLLVDSRDNGLKLASSSNRNSSVIHCNDDWGISVDDLVAEKREMTSSMAAVKLGDDDNDWNSTAIKPDRAGANTQLSVSSLTMNQNYIGSGATGMKGFEGGRDQAHCFKCGIGGHTSRDHLLVGVRGRPRTCQKCGEKGHMSRDCPSGGGGGGPRTCHKCGEEGHMSRNCHSVGGGGGGSRACHKCGEEGHMSRECPTVGGGSKGCRKCGEEGHMCRDCPNAAPDKCFKCNGDGHMSRDCPKAVDGPHRACFKCHSTEHQSRDCSEPVSDLTATISKPLEQYTPFKSGIASGNNFNNFEKVPLQIKGHGAPECLKSFVSVNLNQILGENLETSGYTSPTPVQKGAIPAILSKRDVLAYATAGSGKTAAYLVPVINTLLQKRDGHALKAVIITTVRDSAIKIFNEARKLTMKSYLKTVVIYNGSVTSEKREFQNGCDILVVTAGISLKNLIRDRIVDLSDIQFIILDEADRLMDEDLSNFFKHPEMPPSDKRQNIIFSTTLSDNVKQLAANYLQGDYITVAANWEMGFNPSLVVNQVFYRVTKDTRRGILGDVLRRIGKVKTVIFVDSKKTADYLASYLCHDGFSAASIHGDRLPSQREQARRDFKSDRHNILVATNVSLILGVSGIEYVINYELPYKLEDYELHFSHINAGHYISFLGSETDVWMANNHTEKLTKLLGVKIPAVSELIVNE